jgi:hypothetical protein
MAVQTAADAYSPVQQELQSPCRNFAAITPSDTASLSNVTRFIYVGVTGDVVLVPDDGSAIGANPVTFKAVPAGTFMPVRTPQVMATGTTATNLVALW